MGKSRSSLLFAPNTTGKTRLAQHLKDSDPEGVVLYNAFVEDVFTWDNERVVLKMNLGSELLQTIETQGLDGAIIRNFQEFTHDRIEPTLDFANGEVRFGIHKGDDASAYEVKISRAEESIFVWCVYYSVLREAIDTLRDSSDLRLTTEYDGLKLAVIDDPVSSMDDVRIVTVAIALANLIKDAADLDLKFLVTTHHALFFNVLYNSLSRAKGVNNKAYILQRGSNAGWVLEQQRKDSPFSYHLGIINDIEQAISENSIQRVHFNQFRALLEKTANSLGYTGGWSDLLTGPHAAVLTNVLNLYSHDRFSDVDSTQVSDEYRNALEVEFHGFLKEFRWSVAA
ncbi:MAG: hypothetical protein WAS54_04980 [Scrofimicrobium sp.]